MKQVKIVYWMLIIAFIGLLVYQNQPLFLAKQTIRIDLQFASYELPDLPNVIILMVCFLVGLLISYFFSLSERYSSKKMIKNLNTTIVSLQQKISALKNSLESPNNPGLEEKEDQAA